MQMSRKSIPDGWNAARKGSAVGVRLASRAGNEASGWWITSKGMGPWGLCSGLWIFTLSELGSTGGLGAEERQELTEHLKRLTLATIWKPNTDGQAKKQGDPLGGYCSLQDLLTACPTKKTSKPGGRCCPHPLSENTSPVSVVIPDLLEMLRKKDLHRHLGFLQDWQDAQIKSILNTQGFNLHLFKDWLGLHEIASSCRLVKGLQPNKIP